MTNPFPVSFHPQLPGRPVAVVLNNPELLIAANDDYWTPPKQFA